MVQSLRDIRILFGEELEKNVTGDPFSMKLNFHWLNSDQNKLTQLCAFVTFSKNKVLNLHKCVLKKLNIRN